MSTTDVIVPCYNYGHYLRACVESVLNQAGVDVRVLILDDASPDHTPEVAEELCRDSRVEYRRHKHNCGHIDTFNEGIEWAKADYTVLLSADDLLVPGALSRAAGILDAHPQVGFVHGRQMVFKTEPGPTASLGDVVEAPYCIESGEEYIEARCTAADNPVATPTVVVRTALQHEIGGYRKSLPHTADMELWLRFAIRGPIAWVDAHQACKRLHASNMQYQFTESLGDLKQREAAIDSFLAEHECRLKEVERLRALAKRTLATQWFWAGSRAFDRGELVTCAECLEYGTHLFPALSATPEWSRLQWKRRLGHPLWGIFRPLFDRLRGRIDSSTSSHLGGKTILYGHNRGDN
jgi:glycosyltransferase involved in cell wall biosynthesis